jgi:hypothetical protein
MLELVVLTLFLRHVANCHHLVERTVLDASRFLFKNAHKCGVPVYIAVALAAFFADEDLVHDVLRLGITCRQ